jgi:hypothetical protein
MRREVGWSSPRRYQEKRQKDAIRHLIEEDLEDRELQLERESQEGRETTPEAVEMPPVRRGQP